jgi:phosphopentomutase
MDSVGAGAAPDAAAFGDEGSDTLGHIAEFESSQGRTLHLPYLQKLGLGLIHPSFGIPRPAAMASTARLVEKSAGKDTTTGHWEFSGHVLTKAWPVFPKGFDPAWIDEWTRVCDLPGVLCNQVGSGTQVIDAFGEEHLRSGKPIVYTSADSVFQVAAHEESFGLDRLLKVCKKARELLDPLGVARVIARPFTGAPGTFRRTENRKDFSVPPPFPTLLDVLHSESIHTGAVGKIDDIFDHRGLSSSKHTGSSSKSWLALDAYVRQTQGQRAFVFANFIDFDQLFGHRRDPAGYAQALRDFDAELAARERHWDVDDLIIVTADHGNDPCFRGTDHTRETVPLLFWSKSPQFRPKAHGQVEGFAAVAKLCIEALGLKASLNKLPDAASTRSLW